MKTLYSFLLLLFLSINAFSQKASTKLIADNCESRGCSGSDYCSACKNCSGCKHCAKEGGTCGVCTPAARPAKKQQAVAPKTTTTSQTKKTKKKKK